MLERVAAADTLTFTASSAVQAFLALRHATGDAAPPAHVVCIGPTTAAAAHAVRWGGVEEAADVSAQGIVEAVIAALGSDGGDGS